MYVTGTYADEGLLLEAMSYAEQALESSGTARPGAGIMTLIERTPSVCLSC
jgi:hypothetical protein